VSQSVVPSAYHPHDSVFERLLERYAPQDWWPARGRFEIALGAVLTQGTAWVGAARAINQLKAAGAHRPAPLDDIGRARLARIIRPAGFHNVKALRLKALARWWLDNDGYRGLRGRPTAALRAELLRVHGIGRETADAILLYLFERRVFVIDAYARRLLSRLGLIRGNEGYEALRALMEEHFSGGVQGCNEYHALIVAHGKSHCRARPVCEGCCLSDLCVYPRAA